MPNNLTAAKVGVSAVGDYSAVVTAGAGVQVLIDLLTPDATSTVRNFLDEMSPAAQIQLLKELDTLKTKVNLWEAP